MSCLVNTNNSDFIKFIFSSVVKKGTILNPSISCIDNKCEVKIAIDSEDMKKFVKNQGRLYRAVKMILKSYFNVEILVLTIDLWDKK